MANKRKTFLFIWILTAVVCLFLFLKYASPKIFQVLMGKGHPMPTPSTLMMWYMIMGILAGLVYATTSNKKFADFLSFLLPDQGPMIKFFLQKTLFVGFPVLVGWFVYTWSIPGAASPVELRIQHPTLPQDFEKLENPFRQADADVQRKSIEEGKILFQTYCRPCHGSKADGNGPFATHCSSPTVWMISGRGSRPSFQAVENGWYSPGWMAFFKRNSIGSRFRARAIFSMWRSTGQYPCGTP